MNKNSKPKLFILSIDGGGIRGVYPAYIINKIESTFEISFTDKFGIIAGTSTGSIIAAGLAIEIPTEKILKFYVENGSDIFPSKVEKFKLLKRIFSSPYKSKALQNTLERVFDSKKMLDAKTNLIIPTTDLANGEVHLIKSSYNSDFVRDGQRKISTAVLSSCSAPTYFDPHLEDNYLLADGGLWANNPTMVAIIEGLNKLDYKLENIKVLSIGTGFGSKFYPINQKKWGFINWSSKLIDLILNLQSTSHTNMATLLLGDNHLRINFNMFEDIPLDDVAYINKLKSQADKDFTTFSKQIKSFLEL